MPKKLDGGISVNRVYKDRGIITLDETDEPEQIKVNEFKDNIPVAKVEVASQMTLNLGNYESVQFRVGVTLPCYLEELNDAFKAAHKFVDTKLTKEVGEIREYRSKKRDPKSE